MWRTPSWNTSKTSPGKKLLRVVLLASIAELQKVYSLFPSAEPSCASSLVQFCQSFIDSLYLAISAEPKTSPFFATRNKSHRGMLLEWSCKVGIWAAQQLGMRWGEKKKLKFCGRPKQTLERAGAKLHCSSVSRAQHMRYNCVNGKVSILIVSTDSRLLCWLKTCWRPSFHFPHK